MTSTERPAPWHRRLVVRTAASLAAVALGSAALVGVPLYALASELLERTLDERLEGTAELAALILPSDADPGGPEVRASLALLREEADLESICLYAPDGAALNAPEGAACALAPEDAALLVRAQDLDSIVGPTRADAEGLPYVLSFAPVGEGPGPRRVIGLRAPAAYLERLRQLRTLFGVAGAVWVGLVVLLGRWSAGRLVRPIRGLLAATQRLGAGGAIAPEGEATAGVSIEIQTLQEAFSAMSAAVRSREQGLRALAGSVAHEVRNPSHALRLNLGLLRRELGEAPPGVTRRLDVLAAQLDQLDATVDDFLLLTRDRRLLKEEADLRALLGEAAEGASVVAPQVSVRVNRVLLARAVANLVRNALQAGGAPVEVRGEVGDRLIITVSDHGPGLPPTLVARAFEPFVTGREDGSGLGLAIVASIAAGHGGEARIARTGPEGTVIELDLPLA